MRTMNANLRKQKIALWKKQEDELKKQLVETFKRKGAAAQEGDLSENAAYQGAIEESEVISVRLISIQKMIQELEKGAE